MTRRWHTLTAQPASRSCGGCLRDLSRRTEEEDRVRLNNRAVEHPRVPGSYPADGGGIDAVVGADHPPRLGPRTVQVFRAVRAPHGEGPMLIRAVVHARLLGLRLLTLDARVVVAESDPIEPAMDAVVEVDPTAMPLTRTYDPSSGRQGIRDSRALQRDVAPRPNGGVGQARELLAQSAETLADLRRPVH